MSHLSRGLPAACLLLCLACSSAPVATPPVSYTGPATVEHGHGRLATRDGKRLFEQSWRPRGVQARAVLVVTHGLKDHSARYAELAEQLVAKGIAVYAYDLRGHGRSDGGRVRIERFDEYIGDLGQVVDSVRAREPGRPVFLFGHSMGGAISTLYVMRQPDVAGLVLSAPALKPGSDVSPFLIGVARFLGAVWPQLPAMDLEDANFSRDPKVVEAMRADPLVYQGKGAARTGARLLGALEKIQANLAAVQVPVLVLHGTADKVTDPEGSKLLVQKAGAADKTLKLYPGLFHDLTHEPEKAQVFADVVGWLEARAPGGVAPAVEAAPAAAPVAEPTDK